MKVSVFYVTLLSPQFTTIRKYRPVCMELRYQSRTRKNDAARRRVCNCVKFGNWMELLSIIKIVCILPGLWCLRVTKFSVPFTQTTGLLFPPPLPSSSSLLLFPPPLPSSSSLLFFPPPLPAHSYALLCPPIILSWSCKLDYCYCDVLQPTNSTNTCYVSCKLRLVKLCVMIFVLQPTDSANAPLERSFTTSKSQYC